jgi:uncharacterized membrane protein YhaH (DUF805 family)
MPLRRYADFSGRSRRKEYWMFVLGVILVYLLLLAIGMTMAGSALVSGDAEALVFGGGGLTLITVLTGIVWLGLIIPTLAVGARRLHDIDRSGWWLLIGYGPWLLGIVLSFTGSGLLTGLLSFLSLIGFVVLLVFSVLDGTRGPNRFGPDPKADEPGGAGA